MSVPTSPFPVVSMMIPPEVCDCRWKLSELGQVRTLEGSPLPLSQTSVPTEQYAPSAVYIVLLSGKVGAKWESSSSVGSVTSYQLVFLML